MYLGIIEVLLRGFCVGVAASITVGPVAVLCIQRTLSKNRRSGIVSGLGIASADTLMALIAYSCYSVLQSQIEQYNQLLRVVAGIFVVIVGVYIFFQNPVPQIRRNRAGKSSLGQDFASIFGLTIANFILVIPYILTFFAVFKITTIESFDAAGLGRGLAVLAGFFGGATLWWTSLAFVINLFRRKFRPRHMLTINHVAGIVIGVLGIYTILSTFFNIIPHGVLQG
ncbi:MAG: LysE family transporter [Alistipes sp.]|nr:LysE family transporter [Alistipes sp.]